MTPTPAACTFNNLDMRFSNKFKKFRHFWRQNAGDPEVAKVA